MKNHLLFVSLLCAPIFGLAQQEKIQREITQYSTKIDSLVQVEKMRMNTEMDQLDLDYRNQKISEEQWRNRKKELAAKYEQSINQKIDKESKLLQSITKETAVQSVFRKADDTIGNNPKGLTVGVGSVNVKIKTKKKSPADYLKSNDLAVSYGFLNLTRDNGSFNPFETDSQMRIGNSHSFEIQARRERQLGEATSPFFIRYGVAYRSDTYMPKRPNVFVQQNETLFLEPFDRGNLKRSKLRNVYLTIPVDFQWVLNPKYVEDEGKRYLDGKKSQFRIGVGMYAGVNLRSMVKVKYYDEGGSFDKYKYTLDDGVNPFLFGAKFSIRYGGFNIFIKKDFTPIFNNKALLPAKNGIQIGIDILDIDF